MGRNHDWPFVWEIPEAPFGGAVAVWAPGGGGSAPGWPDKGPVGIITAVVIVVLGRVNACRPSHGDCREAALRRVGSPSSEYPLVQGCCGVETTLPGIPWPRGY